MIITKCKIINFGVLSNVEFNLILGLNTIYQENGYGKTTLAAFIKAMFYGLPNSGNKSSLEENERKKYTPWQGGIFGGNLEFKYKDKYYRIERKFGESQKKDIFTLFDLRTNKESKDFSKDIGFEIFGISSNSYEKSSYFPQKEIDSNITSDINQKLVNFIEKGNTTVNYENAKEILKKKKNSLLYNNNGLIANVKKKIKEIEVRLEYLYSRSEELNNKEEMLQNISLEINKLKERIQELKERIKNNNEKLRLKGIQNTIYNWKRLIVENDSKIQCLEKNLISEEEVNELNIDYNQLSNLEKRIKEEKEKDFSDLLIYEKENIRFLSKDIIDKINQDIVDYNVRKEVSKSKKDDLYKEYFYFKEVFSKVNDFEVLLNNANENIKEYKELLENKPKKIFPWYFITFSIVLIFIVLLSLFLKNVILLITFSSLAFVFICSTILLYFYIKKINKSNMNDHQAKITMLKEAIESFIKEYDENINNYEISINNIQNNYKKYLKLKKINDDQTKESDEALMIIGNSLVDKFNYYCITIINNNFYEGLNDLKNKYNEYLRLLREKDESLNSINKLNEEIKQLKEELDKVFTKYDINDLEYQEGINRLREQISRHKSLLEINNKLNIQVKDYMADNKIDLEILNKEYDVIDNSILEEENQKLYDENTVREKTKTELESSINTILDECESISSLEDSLNEQKELLYKYEHDYKLVNTTIEYLDKSKDELFSNYLKPMNKALVSYIHKIDEDFKDYSLNTNLEISLDRYGENRSIDYLSKGYKDVFDVCMRLALVDNLYKDEKPTLILDDPFVNLDDKKLIKAMSLLEEISKEYQVIYLICHSSRK